MAQRSSWFEDEGFWRTFYPYMFGAERFGRAVKEVDAVLGLVGLVGGDVLDLCCGPGRHAVESRRTVLLADPLRPHQAVGDRPDIE